jgi:hypothetical protein
MHRQTGRPVRPKMNKVAAKRWRLGKRKVEATNSNYDFKKAPKTFKFT